MNSNLSRYSLQFFFWGGIMTDLKPKVRFYAKYRTLKDEVEASIGAMMEKKLAQHHATQHFTYVFSKVKEAFLSSVDYVSYGLTDVVHLDAFDAELCESFLLNRDLKTKVELLDLIEEFFEVNIKMRISWI